MKDTFILRTQKRNLLGRKRIEEEVLCSREEEDMGNDVWFLDNETIQIKNRIYHVKEIRVKTTSQEYPISPTRFRTAIYDFNPKNILEMKYYLN